MKIKRRYPRMGPRLDPTPMADMVFQVLIFFMLTSPFMLQAGIRVKLPKIVTGKAELGEKLILTITKEGKFILDGKEIKTENLENELRLVLLGREEKVLIIRADEMVHHGIVVEALDKAKLAGAEKLAIGTEIAKGAKEKAQRTQR